MRNIQVTLNLKIFRIILRTPIKKSLIILNLTINIQQRIGNGSRLLTNNLCISLL